jgi:hypothetical protein
MFGLHAKEVFPRMQADVHYQWGRLVKGAKHRLQRVRINGGNPAGPGNGLDLFFRFSGSSVSVFVVFPLLPHGKLAAVGKSGGNPHFRQEPTVQNKPYGENDKNSKSFHDRPPIYFIFNIYYAPCPRKENPAALPHPALTLCGAAL